MLQGICNVDIYIYLHRAKCLPAHSYAAVCVVARYNWGCNIVLRNASHAQRCTCDAYRERGALAHRNCREQCTVCCLRIGRCKHVHLPTLYH